jgi:ribosomal-protein-alanine N-acetyltransferase
VAILPPSVGRPADAAALLASRLGGRPCVLIGSGAERYGSLLSRGLADATLEAVPGTLAGAAARLAAASPADAMTPHALAPIYVRRPDAVIARDRHRADLARVSRTSGGFVVSRARTPDEVAAVEALQHDAFHHAWSAGSFRWELEHSDVARLYVLRAPAGELVGYCACWLLADELHVNSVAVAAAWQRRGLATLLLRDVAREAVAAGATSATLEVRESNEAARALYEGLGFKVEGVRRDYYQDPREDATILWKRALRSPAAGPSALRA